MLHRNGCVIVSPVVLCNFKTIYAYAGSTVIGPGAVAVRPHAALTRTHPQHAAHTYMDRRR